MDKLFLSLSLLCLIGTVSEARCLKCPQTTVKKAGKALECRTCNRSLENGQCTGGFGTCITKKHETCLTLKFYLDGAIQFARLMCKEHCQSRTTIRHNETWVYACCWNQNFCNVF